MVTDKEAVCNGVVHLREELIQIKVAGAIREHIEKEDRCLFALADRAFSEEDQQRLLAAFEHVEHEHMGLGTHEK